MKKMDDKVLDVLRKCYYCHKPNAMSRCSRCRLTYYCGVACQKADWKEHKKHCINANVFKEMQAMETGYKSGDPSAELPLVDVPDEISLSSNNSEDSFNHDDCGICLGKIVNGVTLPCHHSLCTACLENYRAHTFDASCPFCRAAIPKDSKPYLLQNAAILVERSNRRSDPEQAQKDLREAQGYIDRLLRLDPALKSGKMLQAMILSKSENEQEVAMAIDLYKQCIGDYEKVIATALRDVTPAASTPASPPTTSADPSGVDTNASVTAAADTRSDGTHTAESPVEALQSNEEAVQDGAEYDMNITCFLSISSLNIKLGRYKDAMQASKGAMALIRPDDIRVRRILSDACDCEYHFGKYEAAVQFGMGALEMNPYFPGAYYQVARAQWDMGDVEAAILTMEKAVVMEAPWDADNKRVVTDQLAEFVRMKNETAVAGASVPTARAGSGI